MDIVLSVYLDLRNICACGPLILGNSRELGNMDFQGVLICFFFGGKKNNKPVLVDEKMLVALSGSLFSELLWTQAPLTLHIRTVTFRGSDESEISAVNSSFHFCE